jgi:hypothetical protein
MEIPVDVFYELYDGVLDKFKSEYRSIHRTDPQPIQIFGLPGYDKKKSTLAESLTNDKTIIEFYFDKLSSVNSRYLYDKRLSLDKKKKEGSLDEYVVINAPYDKLFFLYLGYGGIEEYKEAKTRQFIDYTGYYYSYRKHQICTYSLKVNFSRKPAFQHVPQQEFIVEEQGFHDHKHNPVYSGYGYILEGKLQLMMWVKEGSDRLRILLDSGDDPENQDAMRGIILSVSSYQGKPLTATETVVIRDDSSTENLDTLRIKRYLFLHRYNFRIDSRPLNLHQMLAMGYPADFLRNFVGAWRVLRFEKGKPIFSILYVEEDYHITCYNTNYDLGNLNEQVCLPSISTEAQYQNRNTILLDCYPKEGAKKLSSLMLNIPNSNARVTGGVINVVGGNNLYPFTSAIAMGRDESLFEKLRASENRMKTAKKELKKNNDLNALLTASDNNTLFKEIARRLKEVHDATVFNVPEEIRQL